ncbi:hypothetical protein, partial [Collinsella aerofaciens]|uniref:hypothetical protein n=1 Tax=Collinsella aerofaciens TaxID=74426 RepID=UPI0034A38A3C
KKVYEFVNALVDLYVRPRIGVASRRVLGHERYFVAHFVLQNIAPPAECAGRQHRFGAEHIDLPAHLQIRKLF